jgi:hypothetical protein
MKKNILKKLNLKIKAIKRSAIVAINNLFEDYLVIFCFLFYLNISKKLQLLNNNLNILSIYAIDKSKRYDSILFC